MNKIKHIISCVAASALLLSPSLALATATTKTQGDFNLANHFSFEIGGVAIAGVHSIEGLEHETDVVEYQDGDDSVTHTRPGNPKPGKMTVTKDWSPDDSRLFSWWRAANGNAGNKNIRKNISLSFVDDPGQPAATVNFFECYPVRWQGPNLNAAPGPNVLEVVTFLCERLELVGVAPGGLSNNFVVNAGGDLDGDANPDGSFAYRHAHSIGNTTGFVHDGVSSCKDEIPAGEVQDCTPNIY